MKPLPSSQHEASETQEPRVRPLATTLPHAQQAGFSHANRRAPSPAVIRVYPWLLATSTAVAAAFCALYLTKPVVVQAANVQAKPDVSPPSSHGTPRPHSSTADAAKPSASSLPQTDRLPGESPAAVHPADPSLALPPPSAGTAFEETNLRVQHVLTAETADGGQSRVVLDVPVLYESRNLRWTSDDAAKARELLIQLSDYQDRALALRAEGLSLLDAWNDLVEGTMPSAQLRADSPTLPANQQDAATAARPAELDTTGAIRVAPAAEQ